MPWLTCKGACRGKHFVKSFKELMGLFGRHNQNRFLFCFHFTLTQLYVKRAKL